MKNIRKFDRLYLIALVTCLFSFTAHSQTVFFEEDHSLPIVNLNFVFKVGSSHDPSHKKGLTHFVGEMLKRGSKKYSKETFDQTLDAMGAYLEVEAKQESLVLRGSCLTQALPQYLEIVADLISSPLFSSQEIKKLKAELISGLLEERGNDKSLGAKKWNEFLFTDHPYSYPIHGTIKSIESITREDLLKHYRAMLNQNLFLVLGSGDSDEKTLRSWLSKVETVFSKNSPPFKPLSEPQINKQQSILLVDKPDRTQTQLYLGQRGVTLNDPLFFPLYIGNNAFGGGSFSARLMVEIRAKKGWSYGAYSYFRHGTQPRSWQAYTFPASKDTPQALQKIYEMIVDLKTNGITKEEFAFNQQSLIHSAGFMFNTPKKRIENLLLENTLGLPKGFMSSYGERLSQVSREQVNAALKNYLNPETLKIMILGTAKELKPKIAEVLKLPESKIEVRSFSQESDSSH